MKTHSTDRPAKTPGGGTLSPRPMSERTYRILLILTVAVCLAVTIALCAYTAYAYKWVSIIRFVAGEGVWMI